jgi:hypothetical protein
MHTQSVHMTIAVDHGGASIEKTKYPTRMIEPFRNTNQPFKNGGRSKLSSQIYDMILSIWELQI